jgi:hypothetical protein
MCSGTRPVAWLPPCGARTACAATGRRGRRYGFYCATNDEQAVNANTVHCQAAFAARGLPVPTVNLGTPSYQGSRHLGANVAATAHIVRWFRLLASVPGQDGAQRV